MLFLLGEAGALVLSRRNWSLVSLHWQRAVAILAVGTCGTIQLPPARNWTAWSPWPKAAWLSAERLAGYVSRGSCLIRQPTILDLHSGALSKGKQFVDVYREAESRNTPVFDQASFDTYKYSPLSSISLSLSLSLSLSWFE